jgi:hypothetical protein
MYGQYFKIFVPNVQITAGIGGKWQLLLRSSIRPQANFTQIASKWQLNN